MLLSRASEVMDEQGGKLFKIVNDTILQLAKPLLRCFRELVVAKTRHLTPYMKRWSKVVFSNRQMWFHKSVIPSYSKSTARKESSHSSIVISSTNGLYRPLTPILPYGYLHCSPILSSSHNDVILLQYRLSSCLRRRRPCG